MGLAVMAASGVAAIISLPAGLRTGQLPRRVRYNSATAALHRGRADLGRVHDVARCQEAEPARTTTGREEPGPDIVATVGANLAHCIGHGPVCALVSAWPTLALADLSSY
jgi:hypothetical protein